MACGNRRFFTVIEFLFSVAIIASLAALLMPNLVESRDRASFARWLVLDNLDKNDPAPYGKPDNFLRGKIDEILIYSRALKDAKVQTYYLIAGEHLY